MSFVGAFRRCSGTGSAASRMRIRGCGIVCGVDGVALGGRRQVDGRLRQRRVSLGHTDEVGRILGGHGHRQRLWVGIADVFRRESNETTGDVERIFAGLEHARDPVDSRIRIAVAHRFVERGDQVVVLFAALVVEQRPALD